MRWEEEARAMRTPRVTNSPYFISSKKKEGKEREKRKKEKERERKRKKRKEKREKKRKKRKKIHLKLSSEKTFTILISQNSERNCHQCPKHAK